MPPDAADRPLVPRHGARAAAIRLSLLVAASLTVMASAVISPALPDLKAHFAEVPQADLLARLVITMPALFIALGAPAAGWVIDRFGRRRMIVAGAVLYAFGGASGLVVDGLAAILAGRAVLGIAVAMMMTTAQTLVGDYFAGAERERFLGVQSAFMAFGGVVFVVAGGLLADFHWRGPFAIYMVALLLAPLMAFVLPEPPRHHPPVQTPAQTPAQVAEVRLPVAFVTTLYGTAFFTMLTFFLVPTQVPFLLAGLGMESGTLTGLAIGCFNLSAGVAAMSYGRLRARFGHPVLYGIGFVALAAGFVLAALAQGWGMVALAMVVAGPSMGINMPNTTVWLLARLPAALRGRVLGGMTTALFLGQFLSPVASQPLVDAFGASAAFAIVAAAGAAAATVCFLTVIWRPRRRRAG